MITYQMFSKYRIPLLHILIFSIIYFGRDTLVTTSLLGFFKTQLISIVILFFFISLFIYCNRQCFKEILCDVRIKFLFIIIIYVLLSMIINNAFTLMYVSIIYAITVAIFISFIMDYKQFLEILSNCILFLSFYSIICIYLIKPLYFYGFIDLPQFTNSMSYPFFNLIFSFPIAMNSYIRNFGIFREPGVFQFFITICLISEMFIINRKRKYIHIVILTVSLLSTFSSSGIVQLSLIIIAYFLYKYKLILQHKLLFLCSLIIIFLFIAFIIFKNNNIFWSFLPMITKLTNLNVANPRIEALIGNCQLFFQSPFLGNDINDVLSVVEHNTSSSLILLATFGLLFFLLHLFSWFCILKQITFNESKFNKLINLLILISLFCSFNTQNLTTNSVFWSTSFVAFSQEIYRLWKSKINFIKFR